jgi:hypothetical protein
MAGAEPHPTDEGKFQSTVDDYGHGKGNGKSRSAVYKHIKSLSSKEPEPQPSPEEPETFTKSDEIDDEIPGIEFNSISWLEDDGDLPEPTIAAPIRKFVLNDGSMTDLQRATQDQLIRWGYMGIDRGLTHWGRGVTQDPEWSINRHPQDYEALGAATTNLMDAHGIGVHLNPTTVFAVVVGAAYVPPITHIARNTDVSASGRILGSIKSIVTAPLRLFRRRRNRGINSDTIQAE